MHAEQPHQLDTCVTGSPYNSYVQHKNLYRLLKVYQSIQLYNISPIKKAAEAAFFKSTT